MGMFESLEGCGRSMEFGRYGIEGGRYGLEGLGQESAELLDSAFLNGRFDILSRVNPQTEQKYMENALKEILKADSINGTDKKILDNVLRRFKERTSKMSATEIERYCYQLSLKSGIRQFDAPSCMYAICDINKIEQMAKDGSKMAKTVSEFNTQEALRQYGKDIDRLFQVKPTNTQTLENINSNIVNGKLSNKSAQESAGVFKNYYDGLAEAAKKRNAKPDLTLRNAIDASFVQSDKSAKESASAIIYREKEKAHFDKLYEGVKGESKNAKLSLEERLKNYKADKKFAQETAEIVEKSKYKAQIKQARRITSKNAERAHFVEKFRKIEEESNAAKAALKEKLALKKAARQAAEETKPITETVTETVATAKPKGFFKNVFGAVGKHKIAAGIAATVAIAGGVVYAMSGNNKNENNQLQVAEEKISSNTIVKYNV